MQSAASNNTIQSDNINIMQPQPTPNMIFGSNKKKKCTPIQPLQSPKQQLLQPTINAFQQQQLRYTTKPLNVVSVLKSQLQSNCSSQLKHQQQQHQQHQHNHHHQQHQQQQLQHHQQYHHHHHQHSQQANRSIVTTTTTQMVVGGSVGVGVGVGVGAGVGVGGLNINNCTVSSTDAQAINSTTLMLHHQQQHDNSMESNCILPTTGYLGISTKVDNCNTTTNACMKIAGNGLNGNCGVIVPLVNNCQTGNVVSVALAATANQSGGGGGVSYSLEKKGIVGVKPSSIDKRYNDNKNKLQQHNFQAINEYAPNNGAANGSNARANQSGLFRATPPGNPSARGQTRQIPIQNMYPPQPMPHGVVLSTFTPYATRQPPFPAQQGFPYHSTLPSSFYYPPFIMQQQPQHRGPMNVNANVPGGIAVSGPNVQLSGPPGSTQAQIPLAQTQIISGGVPPGAGVINVGPTPGQVANPQMSCLIPGPIPSHPPQTSKQPKSHPNRLKIIDPNTFKNILDDLDLPKQSTNVESDYQEQQQQQQQQTLPAAAQTDYTLQQIHNINTTTVPTNDHPVMEMGSEIILMSSDNRPNLTYNVRYDADAQQQQLQEQRDTMMNQTPVVSAMSDAPSIEIPNRKGSKKIPIIAPKTDNDLKQTSGTSEEHFNAAEPSSVITFDSNSNIDSSSDPQVIAATEWNENNNYENIEVVNTCSAVQQAVESSSSSPPPCTKELSTNSKLETTTIPKPEQASNLDIKSELCTQANEVNNDNNKKMKKDTSTTATYEEIAQTISSAELLTNTRNPAVETSTTTKTVTAKQNELETAATTTKTTTTTTTTTMIIEKTETAAAAAAEVKENVENKMASLPASCDETDRTVPSKHIDTSIESTQHSVAKIISSSSSSQSSSSADGAATANADNNNTTTTPKTTVNANTVTETKATSSSAVEESNQEETTADANAPAAPQQQQLQSLITYEDGQWSPNNPSGRKQYNKKQLIQLREAQASQIQPAIKSTLVLPQKSLMPSFSKHNNNNSSKSMMMGSIGGNRNSNYGNKPSSISGVYVRNQSTKGEKIKLNLSLNQDVKLNETDNAWKPRVLLRNGETDVDPQTKAQEEKEELIRKVRGILNKLTPEKFDTLVEEIIKLKIDTADKMEDVMVLVFEKAIDEPNFSVSYARLCHRLISEVKARNERMENETKTNLASFRNALLDKTEFEFVQNVTGTAAKEAKLKPITEKIKNCTDPNEKAELEAQLEEEERKLRRRSVGTVRFIGELFKISMLTGKIVNQCIETLLKNNNEDMLECLCKLLTTVGAKFEQTPMQKEKGFYSLDKTIAKMQAIASKTDKEAKVSSRVRFMLQDVIDLRKKNWEQTRNEAPATMGQIEKEAKNAQLTSQYLNYTGSLSTSGAVNSNSSSQMGSNNKRDDRGNNRFNDSRSGYGGSHSQRGESGSMRRQQGGSGSGNSGGGGGNSNGPNDDIPWQTQTGKGSRSTGIDTNKLEALLNPSLDTKKMGGLSLFQWNKDIRQSTVTSVPSNPFAPLSSLLDNKSNELERERDRDRDRDRGGLRNKGSYNKNSMERERYGDRGMNSRNSSSQGNRENSSSRNSQGGMRGMSNSSGSMQKTTSQSKYTQQMPSSRLPSKSTANSSGPAGMYHRGEQPSSAEASSTTAASTPLTYEPPSASDEKLIKTVLTDLLEGAANSKTINSSVVSCFSRIDVSRRPAFLGYILNDYLHLAEVGQTHRRYLANIVEYLINNKTITLEHFRLAYNNFCEIANDLIVDIPGLWQYVFEFTGPLIAKNVLKMSDLWTKQLIEQNVSSGYSFGKNFLASFLNYCTREIGPNFTRTMWKTNNLKFTDFIAADNVKNFIQSNKFEYVEDETKLPVVDVKDKEKLITRVVERVDIMLKEGSSRDSIIDYINGNILDIDKSFIRNLTTMLCNFAIAYKGDSYKLDNECFQKKCIPLLQRYIDSVAERELECLTAMQVLVNSLEHPRGLLSELFGELYDTYVIPQESFIKWRDSKDQSAGKGVAVKGLNPFFNHIQSGETSDENN